MWPYRSTATQAEDIVYSLECSALVPLWECGLFAECSYPALGFLQLLKPTFPTWDESQQQEKEKQMLSQESSVLRHTHSVPVKQRFYWILKFCSHAMSNRSSETIIFDFSYSGISFRDFQPKYILCIFSFSHTILGYLIFLG